SRRRPGVVPLCSLRRGPAPQAARPPARGIRSVMPGRAFILPLTLAALIAGLVLAAWGIDVHRIDLSMALQPPSLEHPFGTDHLGRSVAARLADGLWRTL